MHTFNIAQKLTANCLVCCELAISWPVQKHDVWRQGHKCEWLAQNAWLGVSVITGGGGKLPWVSELTH